MNKKETARDIIFLTVGEAAVAAAVVFFAFMISCFTDFTFDYTVPTGAFLGAFVTVLNFLLLTISVNRAVDSYLEVRGTREMTEQEAADFTAKQSAAIQSMINVSYLARTFCLVALLALAFITGWFNPLCTAIPLLSGQMIITLGELWRKKFDKAPNPENFIKYDNENIEQEEE